MLSLINDLLMYKIKIEKKQEKPKEIVHNFYLSVTMVGPSKCGKTSVMKKMLQGDFPQKHDLTIGTEDYSFGVPLKIPYANPAEDPMAFLKVTELSGNTKYGSLWTTMMKNVPILIFVYDCQKEGSLEETLEFYKLFKKQEQWCHTLCVLMATKADRNVQPKIPFKDARDKAHQMGWLFFKTSAKEDDSTKLKDKFSRIATAAVERWWEGDMEDLWAHFAETPHVVYRFIS